MDETAKQRATTKVGKIVSYVVGAIVGSYAGINLLIPLAVTGGVWWISSSSLPEQNKPVVPALSVNTGHFIWLGVGVTLTGQLGANVFDLIVYSVGLAWLIAKPRSAPLYLLALYQVLGLVVNGTAISQAGFGTAMHKALLVHIIWRALALYFMGKLLLTIRKAKVVPNAP